MTEPIKIVSPIKVVLPRKRVRDRIIYLNLNNYRNWNRFLEAEIKRIYTSLMKDKVFGLVFNHPITLEYVIYYKDKRVHDRMNVGSVVDKYFCDALTEWNCLPDDNDNFILSQKIITGGIDKDNPRCEIFIWEVKE